MHEPAARLAVVEDSVAYRSSLVRTLNACPGWSVVAECAGAPEALSVVPPAKPDLVLLDIHLAGQSGIDIIPMLRARLPHGRIVMLTIEDRADLIIDALESGASGYILKGASMQHVQRSVQEALEGGAAMSPAVATRIIQWFHQRRSHPKPEDFGLSQRQWQVLQLAARGKQRGEIALALDIELNTVKNHLRSIFEKLDAHSINEALLRVRQGSSLLGESGADTPEPGEPAR